MSVIYFLISISVFVAGIFLYIFIRSVKSGQFDDAYTPSVRMLFDDELKKTKPKEEEKDKKINQKENQI
ncbi:MULTISPECIES: cbb3-type cytochrome oxidase assembly protein CcoS [Myroides]|uniref:Cbb3-type cytochrome oxidase assembly protein CcoS n=1 Tax=Myroides odoratus TaxID=256 RepID=A0A378RW95_MYROD|nr:cbb3-type cytochrome oxidase assembly protein CcoS [Myroides odoratus]MDH6601539.1 cbb3-type cytochrome oxidase maturation protein [Myroides gitamensis]EHQ43305.1 cytochrome oxidase maturation protein, cbb3-type [Myroides odoratus DSM 2801]EKB06691.1 cytochrome oxidase maturation protein, cbb3-type [Myroides odoratus CIP 103059]MCS4237717.1 cbb3-type cytochrome oxidase maturation protein [Myroides odoratus]QQU00647.1 cbb3-type cytochrome oxidase assembly protein CcoS [Myroides odoratus]